MLCVLVVNNFKIMSDFMHRFHNQDFGILLLRVGLGVVFLYHGWTKVGAMEQTIGFFGTLGFAPWLAYLVAWAETVGGIALIVGIFSRYTGVVLGVISLVALVKVHLPNGFAISGGGYEFILLLLLGSLAIITMGSGKYSLAGWLRHR